MKITGEKRRTSVNNLPRPRVGANVRPLLRSVKLGTGSRYRASIYRRSTDL